MVGSQQQLASHNGQVPEEEEASDEEEGGDGKMMEGEAGADPQGSDADGGGCHKNKGEAGGDGLSQSDRRQPLADH